MVSGWSTTIHAVDKRRLPPDPDVLEAIGLSHKMTSAIADLVDNSIDARAENIRIRFVDVGGPTSPTVIDDGSGMDEASVDRAMTVGQRRDYRDDALGHFGMGLKAASFSRSGCPHGDVSQTRGRLRRSALGSRGESRLRV